MAFGGAMFVLLLVSQPAMSRAEAESQHCQQCLHGENVSEQNDIVDLIQVQRQVQKAAHNASVLQIGASACGDTITASSTCAQRQASCTTGSDKAQCDRCVYKIHCLGQSSYTGTCYGPGVACAYVWGNKVGTFCFPSNATVQVLVDLDTIAMARMEDLKVGDRVLTAAGFSEVYAFMDHTTVPKIEYLKFRTDSGEELRLTRDHLIFAHADQQPVLAAEVREGDFLWVLDRPAAPGRDGASLKLSRVVDVTIEQANGAHAPLTLEGSVVVDGILASSYAGAQTLRWGGLPLITGHKIGMLLHAPLRFVYKFAPSACAPEWHSTEMGRHMWTQWVLDHFGWLQAINLELHDLQGAFSSLSLQSWASALVQVLATIVLVFLDAVIFSCSPWQVILVLVLLGVKGQFKRRQPANSKSM